MQKPIAIEATHLSKKFAKTIKRGMIYGLSEISKTMVSSGRVERKCTVGNDNLRSGEFWALRDINLTIYKGERVGIIGPNGSGKSTLFSVLSGIYGPTEGCARITGRLQALIALGAGFHPMLSGRENIFINAAILGLGRKAVLDRMEQIIDFSGIRDFIDMPVKNYSSGMLVRLGFSIAANMDPDIMLIDEVLAVGDADFQSKCVGFTQRLADEGRTVVMVSHQLSQVLRICSRVIWLEKGKVVMDGPSEHVVRNYSVNSMQKSFSEELPSKQTGSVVTSGIDFEYEVVPTDHPESAELALPAGERGLPIVFSGNDLVIRIRYKCKYELSGKLNWWLHVKDAISGVRIFGATAEEHGGTTNAMEGCVMFVFHKVPLADGAYCLDLGATDLTRSGESDTVGNFCERLPSFFVVSEKSVFKHPFRVMEDNRLPLIKLPSSFTTCNF